MELYVTSSEKSHFLDRVILKYSSFTKLIRVVAYILRFVRKIRIQKCPTNLVDRYQQRLQFREEIQSYETKKEISNKSIMASLNIILDSKGILRVGRLGNANLQFDQKNPIILNKSHLSSLIIENVHKITLHGGNKLMESMIRGITGLLD